MKRKLGILIGFLGVLGVLIFIGTSFIRPPLAETSLHSAEFSEGKGVAFNTAKTAIFTSKINRLLPEPQASLLNGILFGEKATMQKSFYQALVKTGTIHIVALSGMNITILISLIGQISLIWGRKKSIIISLISLIGFIWFVGPSASVVRAGIMGSLTLFSLYTGRKDWGVLSLFLAAGVMLLFKPEWIFEIGFQLSFLATLGIMTIGNLGSLGNLSYLKEETKNNKKTFLERIFSPLSADLRTTLAAQVFTMPVLLYNFGRLSLIAPLANVLILWVVQPIMILGFILALTSMIYYPLSIILSWVIWVPLTYMIKVIEITSQIPFANISF